MAFIRDQIPVSTYLTLLHYRFSCQAESILRNLRRVKTSSGSISFTLYGSRICLTNSILFLSRVEQKDQLSISYLLCYAWSHTPSASVRY